MPSSQPIPVKDSFVASAVFKIVLTYACFAALWILLSDQAVLLITADARHIALISTIKGWLFVAVTSVLLAFLVRRYLTRLSAIADQLRISEERWKFAVNGAGDGLWDWDINAGTATFSRRYKEMLGYGEDETGTSAEEWSKRVHPDDMARVTEDLRAHMDGKTPSAAIEFRMQCKDGGWKWILGRGVVVSLEKSGKPIRLVGTNTDITGRKLLEAELQRQASIDYLTGVPNRRHFMGKAELELSRAARYGKSPSLLMLDIDSFKRVNDLHGHKTGDSVLRKLGEIFRQTLRDVDTIGRMGGEEFAILLPETGREKAVEVAERLRTTIGNAKISLEQGLPLQITVSIGVASVVSGDDNIDVLLSNADKALYEAKNSGRNRVCVAAP